MAHFPGRRVGTREISKAYGISKHHLVRVVRTLHDAGFVVATAGRSGGVSLAHPVDRIRLGDIVRASEPSFRLVECHDKATNTCPIVPVCGLQGYLDSALEAFLSELDRHTLADLARPKTREKFIQLLAPHPREWSAS